MDDEGRNAARRRCRLLRLPASTSRAALPSERASRELTGRDRCKCGSSDVSNSVGNVKGEHGGSCNHI